ncbi:MAG: DUF2191 domain-containing protein [Opitutaceae bacterium]|nr:DUF2191 domain-containing protein [Opitutaceae bacterium]
MKATIEISDSLLQKAKRLAKDQGVTLRSLTEEGLTKVIQERSTPKDFRTRPVTFKGNGLSKEFLGKSWTDIRNSSYGDKDHDRR